MRIEELLDGFSVEMTGKDVPDLLKAAPMLPLGTRVNVTFLGNESLEMRVAAATAVHTAGLIPVPHISARRIASQDVLAEFLGALDAIGAAQNIFVIAGDPPDAEGPYESAIDLITTAPWDRFGVSSISFGGYPDGHPDIPTDALWTAIEFKAAAVAELGKPGDIITQFGFDVDPVLAWIEQVRSGGIDLPIRVGVPGPAGVKRLLGFARRFGVGSSATVAKKYGFSLTNLLGTAGPDRFVSDLAGRLDCDQHGVVGLHFYAFGGLGATAEWVRDFAASSPEASTSKP